ncbi:MULTISPECIES: M48 family metalloprotease [Micromonospora]|uniref:M56 family peptidase n=1 Tax=Micromonospora solifontis TaxID=2487138 RepID=A0ABX9W9R1_9ACTN|nr:MULTISPECIES: M48 family metalloprotease [Micromonospora]NES17225.1 M48 family metalloprotease [Micromonospora sp. PPF5-17B]NES39428.1 M48 family metalloprotease [Micromonospora solifontis]NES59013.1 M48 family metalloprotease [Micromonospora sp. PPF5-6]RNL88996.1 M56 family peptidase [Micromonospora solifontis]
MAIAIAVSLLVAAVGPGLGRRLPPAAGTRLLVAASVLVAGCSVFVTGVMAFTWIGQLPPVAAFGGWSAVALRSTSPIPARLAAASTVLLVPVAGWWLTVASRRCVALITAYRACRHVTGAGALVVVDDHRPDAFTTPQPAGRIVITTGLLNALAAGERQVVLAHETSHLRHRHAWWLLVADLAAAANPLLRPTARAAARCAERWADEDAATAVGDRRLAARTLARVALLTRNRDLADRFALAATGGDVPDRVRALLAPPPPARPASIAALTALLVVMSAATVMVQHRGEQLFEHAEAPAVAAAGHAR